MNNGIVKLGKLAICFGTGKVTKPSRTIKITLPVTYKDTNYETFATAARNETGDSMWFAFVSSTTTDSITIQAGHFINNKAYYDADTPFNWMTIGAVN